MASRTPFEELKVLLALRAIKLEEMWSRELPNGSKLTAYEVVGYAASKMLLVNHGPHGQYQSYFETPSLKIDDDVELIVNGWRVTA